MVGAKVGKAVGSAVCTVGATVGVAEGCTVGGMLPEHDNAHRCATVSAVAEL
jgi:phage tail tape-measure protein